MIVVAIVFIILGILIKIRKNVFPDSRLQHHAERRTGKNIILKQ
jgi:hypothetical protein